MARRTGWRIQCAPCADGAEVATKSPLTSPVRSLSPCGLLSTCASVLGHLTPIMRLRTSSGGLGYSSDLFGQPYVPNGGHLGVRVSSGHTHHTEGGSYIGRGTVTWDETLFSCHLLCCSIHNMSPPDNTPIKIIGPSVRKRWDENTPSKGTP